jgi:hypothetical protein
MTDNDRRSCRGFVREPPLAEVAGICQSRRTKVPYRELLRTRNRRKILMRACGRSPVYRTPELTCHLRKGQGPEAAQNDLIRSAIHSTFSTIWDADYSGLRDDVSFSQCAMLPGPTRRMDGAVFCYYPSALSRSLPKVWRKAVGKTTALRKGEVGGSSGRGGRLAAAGQSRCHRRQRRPPRHRRRPCRRRRSRHPMRTVPVPLRCRCPTRPRRSRPASNTFQGSFRPRTKS